MSAASSLIGSRKPKLQVELGLEQNEARVTLYCDSYEDEIKFRLWLRRSAAFAELPANLERLLDDLDELDQVDDAA